MMPKTCTIKGVEYPSVSAAAKALGLSISYVARRVQEGEEDRIKGVDMRRREARHKIGRAGDPITIRGVTYPSHAVAAEALGVSSATISNAKTRGTLDTVGLGAHRLHAKAEG